MNKVFYEGGKRPLTPLEIKAECCAVNIALQIPIHPIILQWQPDDFAKSRLSGAHCDCNGDGEFELLSLDECLEGGKRYMKCRKCGGVSHL